MATVWSIVVAGGSGSRFGAPKQFALLAGRPVLEWSVAACRTCSDGIVLVLPEDSGAATGVSTVSTVPAVPADRHGADTVVSGGPTRADSVRRGLAAVPDDAGVIVVHDAARPLASPGLFAAVVGALGEEGVDGAVPGLMPADTIKVVDRRGCVERTLDRSRLVAVQTPQAFRADVLRRAHEHAGPDATDDAMVVEGSGGRVKVVPGETTNLKITGPGDLGSAELFLARDVPGGQTS